ncbi:serine protease gd-like [Temnothorax nylanderi]|uniref:serine protease gd-like n=1 Tax=Temnothorax nylanderi TaxID=102681 RepID=UPI003A84EE25
MIKIFILSVLLPDLVYTIVRSTTETIQERNTNNNNECGITSYYTESTNSLIPNGEYALPGQWPWVVALNRPLNLNNKYRFQCTGSILTNRHILTAATCLELNTKYNDIMKVALGQFNLRHGSRVVGTVNRKVESYKIHPNANWRTGDSDLAILILSMPVEFSPFIRPICLWSGSTDIENVVDRTGYVVGWASNETITDVLVSEPRMLKMPIVNQTCLRSHDNHSSLTIFTEGTFCGYIGSLGLSGETNPCYGDIGSGLVLFDNSTGRYQLRGILSQFNLHRNRDWCGVGKYINYVDMANNTLWIQQQISTT